MKPKVDLIAKFTWLFGNEFFLETSQGNFIWSDPSYGGNNVIRRTDFTYQEYLKISNVPFGRDKGEHFIKDYCGPDVIWDDNTNL